MSCLNGLWQWSQNHMLLPSIYNYGSDPAWYESKTTWDGAYRPNAAFPLRVVWRCCENVKGIHQHSYILPFFLLCHSFFTHWFILRISACQPFLDFLYAQLDSKTDDVIHAHTQGLNLCDLEGLLRLLATPKGQWRHHKLLKIMFVVCLWLNSTKKHDCLLNALVWINVVCQMHNLAVKVLVG